MQPLHFLADCDLHNNSAALFVVSMFRSVIIKAKGGSAINDAANLKTILIFGA